MKIVDNLTTVNYNKGRNGNSIKWIVVHNTANSTSKAGTAKANTNYFKSVNRNSSAHYFIDDGDEIYRCVKDSDTAWHCGDSSKGTAGQKGCKNYNSIGIEVCEPADGIFTDKEKATLRELVLSLMSKYNVSADHVVRHYDVSTKNCPKYYSRNNSAWSSLRSYITTKPTPAPDPKKERVQIMQASFNATDAQQWKLVKDGSYYKIQNKSGKVLDVKGGEEEAMKNGRVVQAWRDNGTDAQRWKLVENPNIAGTFFICSKLDENYVLDVVNGTVAKRAYLQLHKKQTEKSKQWAESFYIVDTFAGYKAILNAKSLYVVDANPTNIVL